MGAHARETSYIFTNCDNQRPPQEGTGMKTAIVASKEQKSESVGREAVCHSGCVIFWISC